MVESGAARPAPKERARAIEPVAVVSAGITSTSFCTGTGLKKYRPRTWAGRPVATARSTTGIQEALVSRTASGPVTTRCEAILEPVTNGP